MLKALRDKSDHVRGDGKYRYRNSKKEFKGNSRNKTTTTTTL